MADEDEARQLWVTASEIEARAHLGKVMLFGGCPYRVTGVEPVAQLRWAILGVPMPVHPEPGTD